MVVRRLIAGLLAAVLLALGATAWSQAKETPAPQYVLDIPRLPLIAALKEFITQTGLMISFWPDAQTDQTLMLGPLRGKYTAEEALTKLLANSGLAFQRANERALVVMAPSLFRTPRNGVAPSDEDQDQRADSRPNSRSQNQPPREHSVAGGKAGSVADESAISGDPIDEIIVTGSRLERSGEGPAPTQVFTRETIDELGAVSIPDVLRYTTQQPFIRAEHYYQNGAQYSQMRGIGVDTTLVLVNGRRVAPTSNSLSLNAFDLNSVPLAAVDSIQVLSDSASAIYGADAMGGVINIVLKKELPQPVFDLEYGEADGGGNTRRASLSGGYYTDRFRTSIILDYFEREFLLGAERGLWRDQDYRRHGGTDYRSAAGSPGTVSSVRGDNLPGLSRPFAAIPVGSAGIGMTPADFVATAGQRNLTSTLGDSSIVPEARRRSALLVAEYDFSPELTTFAQILYTNRDSVSQAGRKSMQGALVPASNPFNPFQQPVVVDFLLNGVEPLQFVHQQELFRGVAGLRGSLGSSWEWEVSGVASVESDDALTNNEVSASRVSAALAASDPAQALNPFVDGPAGSPELLASLIEPTINRHFSRGRQAAAFLRGPLFPVPAGSVDAVIGGEWRDEDITYDDRAQFVKSGRQVTAAFTELNIPLLGATAESRGNVLSMTAAARFDDYDDFDGTLNPQFGLLWRPMQGVLLRGSYGTSFRPPSLFELRSPRLTVPGIFIPDPARNNAISSVTFVAGGNPDLRPIEADSLTAGFVLTPERAPKLRLLANYWRIRTNNRVTMLPFAIILANEDAFASRIIRAAPTPQDVALGIPGSLLQMDISRVNFGRLTTDGIDLELSYEINTAALGDFTMRWAATWVDDYVAVDLPGTEPIDRVGIANSAGSIPRWRVVGTVGWKRNGVGLSTTVDWIPEYRDASATGATGRRLPDRALVDVQATFGMDELLGRGALWQDLKLQAGVKNVFDKMAPFSDIGFAIGFDSSQGDLLGRYGYIKLSKGF